MPKVNTDPKAPRRPLETVDDEDVSVDLVEQEDEVSEIDAEANDDDSVALNLESMVDGASTALDTIQNNKLAMEHQATGPFQFDESPEFTQEEIDLPRMRLLQPVSDAVTSGQERPGHWLMAGYEATPTINFYPIGLMRRRMRAKDGKILCQSSDNKNGVGDPGGLCAVCPMAQWGPRDEQTGKGTPPECSQIYDFLGIDIDKEAVCVLSFQKTSMKAAKWLNTMASSKGGKFGSFAVTIGSQLEGARAGGAKYFTPKMSLLAAPKSQLLDLKNKMFPPDEAVSA